MSSSTDDPDHYESLAPNATNMYDVADPSRGHYESLSPNATNMYELADSSRGNYEALAPTATNMYDLADPSGRVYDQARRDTVFAPPTTNAPRRVLKLEEFDA
jgi:hypothetical protein